MDHHSSKIPALPNSRLPLALALAAILTGAAAVPAQADLSTQVRTCRAAIAKSATKLTRTLAKAVTICHIARDRDASLAATDCNNPTLGPGAAKVSAAETKFKSVLTGAACASVTPVEAMYETGSCPSPCDSLPVLSAMQNVADCLICLGRANVSDWSETVHGTPSSPLSSDARRCDGSIGKAGSKLFSVVMKEVSACQVRDESAGATSSEYCTTSAFPDGEVDDATLDAMNAVVAACDIDSFTGLDSCDDDAFGIAGCVGTETQLAAQVTVSDFLSLQTTTTTTSTTTTTLPPIEHDPLCPSLGELELLTRDSNFACNDNTDCPEPRTCNTTANICQSRSELDSGWTGHAHQSDLNDGVLQRSRLLCPGPTEDPDPICGQCFIDGVEPIGGSCRCSNNTRTICDQPFRPDMDDCGGSVCDCYFGVPIPLSSAGTPACIVNRYSEDISGTANVDTGDSEISAKLRTKVFLGISTITPCPYCAGTCSNSSTTACLKNADCGGANTCAFDTPNDGDRDGLCVNGENNAQTCDAGGTNPTFPAQPGGGTGGGGYSLDCMPSIGINISGAGLALAVTQTTGTSELTATIPCAGGVCWCKTCSASPTTPCNSNDECTGGSCAISATNQCVTNGDCDNLNLGICNNIHRCQFASGVMCTTNADCQGVDGGPCNPSTCSVDGNQGYPPMPNGCNDVLCSDTGDGISGQCTTGPDEMYCDGLLRPDGSGISTCQNNDDCVANDPLNGNCTITQRRPCFLNPIIAVGEASTDYPIGAATFCVPPTANSSINQVAGLPGPTRAINQAKGRTFCASDPQVQYEPGVGGCPAPPP